MGNILSFLNSSVGLGLLRNLLMAAGSIEVTQGVITQGSLNDVVGAVLVILGIVFSAIANRTASQAKAVVQAVNDHPSLSIIPADQTSTGKPIVTIAPSAADMAMGNMDGGVGAQAHLQ
jgi:hypothetical protein